MMLSNNKNDFHQMANAIRALSIDAIEKANSGHPGMPLGIADVATVLFAKYIKFDPSKPDWIDRDRFVLSAGHGSMLLYALSYLLGYKDCKIDDIKQFRQLGSKTAGHPEYKLLDIIETTTGPLGQGLANAVGMAIAEKNLSSKFGDKLINHKTWVIVGDGCLMEGISQEAISLAGHLNLNNLIVFFDNNGISIDGSTNLTCSDDQTQRFKASKWATIEIDGHNYKQIDKAIKMAIKSKKPTFISCKTIIGYGSPNKSGKSSCHGSPLGKSESEITKKKLGWEYAPFEIPKKILSKWRNVSRNGTKSRLNWEKNLDKSELKNAFLNQFNKKLFSRNSKTNNFLKNLVKANLSEATRKSSQNALELFLSQNNNLLGGSADLTGSNLTKTKFSYSNGHNFNYIYYGVREHLMAAAMNGISVHGGFIPYGGTFLIFSDYCKNAIRLSAMMKRKIIYVLTHDSIGLGEDGPTHQPIEQLAGLRAIPNLNVFRPCDAIETFESWELALNSENTPSVLALSRQSLPLIRKSYNINKSSKGGYFLNKNNNSRISIIATGSEVMIASQVQKKLKENKIESNLISIPCVEIFERQSKKYKENILGENPRILIEASTSFGWYKFLRQNDTIISIDTFGESGKGNELFNYFGFESKKITSNLLKKYFSDNT